MTPSVDRLIEYFRKVAIFRGRSGDESKGADHQAPYSLAWFYENCENVDPSAGKAKKAPIKLNRLCRAYFGDKKSWEAVNGDIEQELSALDDKGLPFDGFIGREPNEEQQEAIKKALSLPISFIQGPPGTGKTATILNIMAQAMKQGSTVAVISSNNSAIENIVEKIKNPSDDSLLAEMQQKFAALGNATRRAEWSNEHEGASYKFEQDWEKRKNYELCAIGGDPVGGWEPTITAENFLRDYPIITSTIHSLKKCFADGVNYQFDYVIMDEASQTDVLAGVVAMSCAEHLVLVGDDEQLPPVSISDQKSIMEDMRDSAAVPEDSPHSLAREDFSFLGSCYEVFPEEGIRTMLKKHYRCHPGIIGFCNEYVYNGNLEIMTEKDSGGVEESKLGTTNSLRRLPISIRWFRGDYSEKGYFQSLDDLKKLLGDKDSKSSRKPCASRRNGRQLTIFFEEEWPHVLELINEGKSISFIAPYRLQLAELKKRLDPELQKLEYAESRLEEHGIAEGRDQGLGAEGYVSMLTVHKSQGREFDVVYFMPVDDGTWEWPWSQKKRLVNVAVSRAKEELRVIVSSALMSFDMRKELGVQTAADRKHGSDGKGIDDHKRITTEERADSNGELFVQKLVEYVRDNRPSGQAYPESDEEFGFHRSVLTSIFDDVSELRTPIQNLAHKLPDSEEETWSGPEACISKVLFERAAERELAVAHNVPLSEIFWEGQSVESDGSARHFDFIVCEQKTGHVILAVEVDGAFHRYNDDIEQLVECHERDAYKDEIATQNIKAQNVDWTPEKGFDVQALSARGSAPFAFVRIPVDGSTFWETGNLVAEARKSGYHVSESFGTLDALIDDASSVCDGSVRVDNNVLSRVITQDFVDLLSIGADGDEPLSLSRTLDEWRNAGNCELTNLLQGYDARKLQPILQKLDLIKKENGGWTPTKNGNQIGIVLGEGKGKSGKPYTYPVYRSEARGRLKDILLANRHLL